MAEQETISVSIFDKSFKVSCPPDEVQALRDSAHYLDTTMREVKSARTVMGLDRVAVMAALNIANELLTANKQRDAFESEKGSAALTLSDTEDRISALVETLKQR